MQLVILNHNQQPDLSGNEYKTEANVRHEISYHFIQSFVTNT